MAAGLLAAAILSSPAEAFHSPMLFPDDASVGGGGGFFYTGSPRHKGYTCAICHVGAPGLASLAVASEPAHLLEGGVYEPNEVYALSVRLEGETRGLDSFVNYNGFSVEVLDSEHRPAGSFRSFVEGGMVTTIEIDALFALDRRDIDATRWSFEWKAPGAGAGPVDFYFAGVDGDGAGSAEAEATDPQGDDVVLAYFGARPAGEPAPAAPESAGCALVRAPRGATTSAGMLVLWLVLCCVRGRRRRRQSVPA